MEKLTFLRQNCVETATELWAAILCDRSLLLTNHRANSYRWMIHINFATALPGGTWLVSVHFRRSYWPKQHFAIETSRA